MGGAARSSAAHHPPTQHPTSCLCAQRARAPTGLVTCHAAGMHPPWRRFDNYFGRKIAVDASMHIYQFLVVVGRQVRGRFCEGQRARAVAGGLGGAVRRQHLDCCLARLRLLARTCVPGRAPGARAAAAPNPSCGPGNMRRPPTARTAPLPLFPGGPAADQRVGRRDQPSAGHVLQNHAAAGGG